MVEDKKVKHPLEDKKEIFPYEDIIHLPHHVSSNRAQMLVSDRAAQFSPFAALTGFDGEIKETARLTDKRMELEEGAKAILDEKLRILNEQLSSQPEIIIEFFQPDELKAGGAYLSVRGTVKKIDAYHHTVVMQDGKSIPIEEIVDITGEMFRF